MEEQTAKNEEKQSLFVRGLLSFLRVLLIIGLLFYVLYHLTNGFSAELRTETVTVHSQQMTLNTSGVIVRSETALENSTGGVVSYRYENGSRVNKGAKVAVIYGSGDDAQAVARVAEIDETVDFLTEAGVYEELTANDGISAGKKISEAFLSVSDGISRGNYGSAASYGDEILRSFLVRSAALEGEDGGISTALSSLGDERSRLAQSLSGVTNTVTAKVSGYFYDYADGAENVFDYGNITSLTPEQYSENLAKTVASSSSAAGKIVTLAKWYFVCPAKKADCTGLSEGSSYDVLFSMSDMTLKMELEAKNTVGDDTVLVFSSSEMPAGFDFSRSQKVSLITDTVSGYRVPSSALRVVDGNVGVYIRSGNTVRFRAAEVIYESGSYSYVSTKTEGVTLYALDDDETNDVYCKGLTLYDNVIISGAKELYPDRIVN